MMPVKLKDVLELVDIMFLQIPILMLLVNLFCFIFWTTFLTDAQIIKLFISAIVSFVLLFFAYRNIDNKKSSKNKL